MHKWEQQLKPWTLSKTAPTSIIDMDPRAQASNIVSKYHHEYPFPYLKNPAPAWLGLGSLLVSLTPGCRSSILTRTYNKDTRVLSSNHRKLSITVWGRSQCPLHRHLALCRYHRPRWSYHRGLITHCDHYRGICECHTVLMRFISGGTKIFYFPTSLGFHKLVNHASGGSSSCVVP